MKKIFSLLLVFAISVFADVKAGVATTPVEPALGSAENPLLIESVQDLARLRDVLNSKGSGVFRGVDMANFAKGVYFKQTVDINLFELDDKWEPIQKFSGHYDGAGHEIDGMVIEADSAYAAKFSEVAFIAQLINGSIRNLTIGENSSVVSKHENVELVASLVGEMSNSAGIDSSIIENCVNKAKVIEAKTENGGAGGLVGEMSGDYVVIRNSKNYALVSGVNAGGVVGGAIIAKNADVAECENFGDVNATYVAGGVIALLAEYENAELDSVHEFNFPVVSRLVNHGKVNADDKDYLGVAGGIVGKTAEVTVSESYNDGFVSSYYGISGGIVGSFKTKYVFGGDHVAVEYCVNAGTIKKSSSAGGIVGSMSTGFLRCNLNIGSIEGNVVGGILGSYSNGYDGLRIVDNVNASFIQSANMFGNIVGEADVLEGYEANVNVVIAFNLGVGSMLKERDYTKQEYASIGIGEKQKGKFSSVVDTSFVMIPASRAADDEDIWLSTKELTSGSLPESFNRELWVATPGYYPVLKDLLESDVEYIAKAAAIAAVPVYIAEGDRNDAITKPVMLTKTDVEGNDAKYFVDHSRFTVSDTALNAYNVGGDTIHISNGVASRTLYLTNAVTGEWGTRENPLRVTTMYSLMLLRDAVNSGSGYFPIYDSNTGAQIDSVDLKNGAKGLHFVMDQDIDMIRGIQTDSNWVPIGTADSPFRGHFNGAGYTISNMRAQPRASDVTSFNAGLFGVVEPGDDEELIFENIKLDCVKIVCKKTIETINIAPLLVSVSMAQVKVINSKAAGTIEVQQGFNSTYSTRVGGLVGSLGGDKARITLENDTSYVDIDAYKVNGIKAGGILANVNYGDAYIRDCVYKGRLVAEEVGAGSVGGLAGNVATPSHSYELSNNVVDANIRVSNPGVAFYIGGLTGYASNNDLAVANNKIVNSMTIDLPKYSMAYVGGSFGQMIARTITLENNQGKGHIGVTQGQTESADFSHNLFVGGFAGELQSDYHSENNFLTSLNNAIYSYVDVRGEIKNLYAGGAFGRIYFDVAEFAVNGFENHGYLNVLADSRGDTVMAGGIVGAAVSKSDNNKITLGGVNYNSLNLSTAGTIGSGIVNYGGILGGSFNADVHIDGALNSGRIACYGLDLDSLAIGGLVGESRNNLKVTESGNYGYIYFDNLYSKIDEAFVGAAVGRANKAEFENVLLAGSVYIEVKDGNTHVAPYVGSVETSLKANNVLNATTLNVEGGTEGFVAFPADKSTFGTFEYANLISDSQLAPAAFFAGSEVDFEFKEGKFEMKKTKELVSGELPAGYSEEMWVAKKGYYPQLKIAAEKIKSISATAAIPLILEDGDIASIVRGKSAKIAIKNAVGADVKWRVHFSKIAGDSIVFPNIKKDSLELAILETDDYYKAWYLNIKASEKSELDMSAVAWNYTAPFKYDAKEHSVEVSGLPEGVAAVYEGNVATMAGEYKAAVTFEYDEDLYYKPEFENLTWKILKDTLDVSKVKWVYDSAFVYDGKIHSVSLVNVPEQILVDYVNNQARVGGENVARAYLNYDTAAYVVVGEFVDSLKWAIVASSVVPVDTNPHDTIAKDSLPADVLPRDTVPADTVPKDTTCKDKDDCKVAIPYVALEKLRLVKDGGNLVLQGGAIARSVRVFDVMGNVIPVKQNSLGNDVMLMEIPKNRTLLVHVTFKTGAVKTFKIRL